jgi:hypothetical protein
MYGGDWATNILLGAAFGGIGGYVAPGLYGAIAGATGSQFVGVVGTAAILGGAFGGVSAAIHGGNILEGIASGAVSAAMLAAASYGGYKFINWVISQNEMQAAQAAQSDCWSAQCHSDALKRAVRQLSLAEKGGPEPLCDEGPGCLYGLPPRAARAAAEASIWDMEVNIAEAYEKITGPFKKAGAVGGLIVTGNFLMRQGFWLAKEALTTMGRFTGPYVAAHGGMVAVGGATLTVSGAALGAYWMLEPTPAE